MAKPGPPSATVDELGRAHASLLKDLGRLERMLVASTDMTVLNMLNQLTATHSQITDHFGVEEQNGWMEEVGKQEPRLQHAIQNLHDEHRQLVQALDTLMEDLEAKEKVDDVCRQKVARWIERVRAHESRENELLEDAFVEDLGAGD